MRIIKNENVIPIKPRKDKWTNLLNTHKSGII